MKAIKFLRPFSASRVLKGKFRLAYPDGGGNHGFAFGQWENHFKQGQKVLVRPIKQGTLLVVTDNPVTGEVVLDGAVEGVDYEIASTHETQLHHVNA